ncbi:glutathione S-transferase 1-like [Liolophura sinensis]|uniref:glutathione S-transferase 1-like n=1 Tax=Liolophura sinensis TaxID=3198878 RepID=UPI0031582FB6
MPAKYRLTYFNSRGRGEVIRLIFKVADEEFEDRRMTAEDWSSIKSETPFGQVPMLEVDGKVLAQSNTICRYLAREFGLAGKDVFEQARVDMFVDLVEDLLRPMVQILYEKDEIRKEEIKEKYAKETAPTILSQFEKHLAKNPSGFLVGDSLTWADLHFMNWLEKNWVGGKLPVETWNRFPKIKEHNKMVASLPRVKEWLETRPKTEL